jgi:hypothetical protein
MTAPRGSAFAYVSRLTINMLATTVTLNRKRAQRYQPLDDPLIACLANDRANQASAIALDDLEQQIRSISSACSQESERSAQKWYVESFIDSGFSMPRHEFSNTVMKVFGRSHPRSRALFDLTLLEIRRALYSECFHEPARPEQLYGTKGLPLLRYINFLSPQEFAKITILMRDLAPSLVVLVKPANEAGIRRREWPAVRENLEWVLHGIPDATPLFSLTKTGSLPIPF